MDLIKNIKLREKDGFRLYDLYNNEVEFRKDNLLVVGIDEAGRGPLAGPVCVSCVALPFGTYIKNLDDSKKIKAEKRLAVSKDIISKSYFYTYGFSSVEEIDEINILEATLLAMKRAVEKLPFKPDLILIDGDKSPNWEYNTKTIVKGDQKIPSIAAASILAKERRDFIMGKIESYDNRYKFSKHKGYGTSEHYEEINKYGISIYHRKSFLKRLIK